jgi:hypothetical protein
MYTCVDLTKAKVQDRQTRRLVERTPHDGSQCNSQTWDLKSGHKSQKGA